MAAGRPVANYRGLLHLPSGGSPEQSLRAYRGSLSAEEVCRLAVRDAVWAAAELAAGMPKAGLDRAVWCTDAKLMKTLHGQALHFAHACGLSLDHWVRKARSAGLSWGDVGEVMGVSRQAAQQRYGSTDLPVDELRDALEALAKERKVGTYTSVGKDVGLHRQSPRWPQTLAAVTARVGVRLDVLVVAERTGLPGAGFYTDLGASPTATTAERREIFEAEKAKVHAVYAG